METFAHISERRPRPMRLLVVAGLLFAFAPAKTVLADTYTDYIAAQSNGNINNIGFVGSSLEVSLTANYQCGAAISCFGLFTPGSSLVISPTSVTTSDGTGPGGYSLFTTHAGGSEDLYVSHNGVNTLVFTGDFGEALVNSFGDVAFLAYDYEGLDTNFLAINDPSLALTRDESAPAITPEPSALALLGTAIAAGALVRIKRRRRTDWLEANE